MSEKSVIFLKRDYGIPRKKRNLNAAVSEKRKDIRENKVFCKPVYGFI